MKRSRGIVVLMLAGLWLSAFIGCSQPTPEELASLAAKGYYDHLIRGEYEHFLEGLDERPNIDSADYRSQLLDCYAQFVAQQENDYDTKIYQCVPGALLWRFHKRGDCRANG